MTEEQAKEQTDAQQFMVQRVYLKDLSLEAPMGAKAFVSQQQPSIDQDLGTEATKLDDNLYEVVLQLTITAKIDEETAFLIEIHQAGLFLIKGIEGQNLSQVLNTVCPQILFPYARETIDSALVKATFPPLMLPPINFDALYAQAMEDQKEKAH